MVEHRRIQAPFTCPACNLNSPAQVQRYPGFREELRGFGDLKNGIDLTEARAVQKRTSTLTADPFRDLNALDKIVDHYLHGTLVADIVARGIRLCAW